MKRPAIVSVVAWGLLLALSGTAQAAGDPAVGKEERHVHRLPWNRGLSDIFPHGL